MRLTMRLVSVVVASGALVGCVVADGDDDDTGGNTAPSSAGTGNADDADGGDDGDDGDDDGSGDGDDGDGDGDDGDGSGSSGLADDGDDGSGGSGDGTDTGAGSSGAGDSGGSEDTGGLSPECSALCAHTRTALDLQGDCVSLELMELGGYPFTEQSCVDLAQAFDEGTATVEMCVTCYLDASVSPDHCGAAEEACFL